MDKEIENGKPSRLKIGIGRNTSNLGVLITPNLLVLLSRIKFYEFFGLSKQFFNTYHYGETEQNLT